MLELVDPTIMESQLENVTVSQVHKLMYIILTGPDFGYEDVRIETVIGTGNNLVDIYVPEANMIIEIDGPAHFFNRKHDNDPFIPTPSLSRRLLKKNLADKKFVGVNVVKGGDLFVGDY